jgi:AcrR family transcriptional regulator
LLKAAADCFARQGYAGTSVAQVCQAAGVSKGAFYHHFDSKQALFLSLFHDWLATLDQQLAAARLGAPTIAEGILRMAEGARSVFNMTGINVHMFLEFLILASREPWVWQVTVEPYQRFQQVFSRVMQAGIDEGSFRQVDADTAARVLVALAVGLLLQSVLKPDDADWGQVAQDGVALLIQGLRSSPACTEV